MDKSCVGFIKKLLQIAAPIVLQQIINIGVNVSDGIMVGKLKESVISGVSISNQFYMIFQIFCLGLGGGAAVIIGQFWGRKDKEAAKKTITFSIWICAITAIAFSAVSWFIPDKILLLFISNTEVIEAGRIYLSFLAFAYIFHGISLVLTISYRAAGVLWISFISSFVSFVLNLLFNWILIFGKFGMPSLGAKGAAIATVISRAAEFLIVAGYILFVEKTVGYRIKDIFKSCKGIGGSFEKFALPVIISDVMLQLGNNVTLSIMGHMPESKNVLSANEITTVMMQISTFMIFGVASAASVMTGNAIGENAGEKVVCYAKRFVYTGIATGVFAAIAILLCNPYIISLYNVDSATVRCAYSLMRAMEFLVVFQAVSSVFTKGVLRGAGDTKAVMLLDVFALWGFSVPVGFACGIVLKMSPFWVYMIIKFDVVIKTVWSLGRIRGRRWIRRVE